MRIPRLDRWWRIVDPRNASHVTLLIPKNTNLLLNFFFCFLIKVRTAKIAKALKHKHTNTTKKTEKKHQKEHTKGIKHIEREVKYIKAKMLITNKITE